MARSTPTTPIEAEINARMRSPRAGSIPFDGSDMTGMPPRADLGRVERRAMLGISVPRRSAWPDLTEIDERIGDLAARHGEAMEVVRALHERRANAPSADADRLAEWELGGRKGAKPAPTADALDGEIADAELSRDALERAGDVVLEAKGAFIAKNRDRLAAVADQQTEVARERMIELVDELERTRDAIIECRQAATWARCYPDAAASGQAPTSQIACGRAQPIIDELGLRPAPQLMAASLLALFRQDAELLATVMTPAQREHLGGDAKPKDGAPVWVDTDEGRAQARRVREQERERYERERRRP